jgi:hypothetical protein
LAADGLRDQGRFSADRSMTPVFITVHADEFDQFSTSEDGGPDAASSRSGTKLICNHQFQRFHRLEILGRDLRLGNNKIKLGFNLEH